MTTAISTVTAPQQKARVRLVSRLAGLIRALADTSAGWAASFYDSAAHPASTETLPAAKRIEAALRWHARHGRVI